MCTFLIFFFTDLMGAAFMDSIYIYFWLETTEIYSLTLLEVRNLKSKCWQDHISSEASKILLSFLPLPASKNLEHSLVCRCITPISASAVRGVFFFPLCLSLATHSFFISHEYILHWT